MSDTQAERSASTSGPLPISQSASEASPAAESLERSQNSTISSPTAPDANTEDASRNSESSSTPTAVPTQISSGSDAGGAAGTVETNFIAITSTQSTSAVPIQSETNIPSSKAAPSLIPLRHAPPNDTASAFNSTVAITLNAMSPMINFEDPLYLWKLDPDTGYRTYGAAQNLHSDRSTVLRFVGVGYGMNGTAGFRDRADRGSNPEANIPAWNLVDAFGFSRKVTLPENSTTFGETYNLNLTAYEVQVSHSANVNLAFHNATIHIPVKTQAPNFTAMLSQAKTVPASVNNQISYLMDTSFCTVRQELEDMYTERVGDDPAPHFVASDRLLADAFDWGVLLWSNTELVYPVPQNTTLVEVIGPAGNYSLWRGMSECYAFLNPRPSWWQYGNFPRSSSYKIVNATDQTVFLLPIDPSIKFELRIGPLGNATNCPLSAIRTYPFHYDFSADLVNSTNSNTTLTSGGKEANPTSIIVGVVVGVGGGLILLGIIGWLLRRHRKQREEREKGYLPDPYSNDGPVEPRSKADLEQMARGEDPRRAPSPGGSDEETTVEPRRRRGHRIVQEEDGESVVEYLPPQYREAWQISGGRGPSHYSEQDDPRLSSEPEVQQLGGPSSAPIQDRALEEKVGRLDSSDQPPLKQAYARVFSRALPRPPQSSVSSDQRQSGSDASDGGLKQEYIRRFGLSPRGPREAGPGVSQVNAAPGAAALGAMEKRKAEPIPSQHGALSSIPRPRIDRRLSIGSADSADQSSSSQLDDNTKEEYNIS